MDNDFILLDRIDKIKQIISQYGEDNFFISFSGGKDSTVLHYLIDLAIPNNTIPRVFVNTGIEYNEILSFVTDLQKTDTRIVVIKPNVPIKTMLETEGYPFKSKTHSKTLDIYQRKGDTKCVVNYREQVYSGYNKRCPKKLKYQFSKEFDLRVSDKCCDRLKKDVLHKYQLDNSKPYSILGIMASEGGRRDNAKCLAFNGNKLKAFQPLAPLSKDWEDWFIKEFYIPLCKLYYPPFNFTRTGCKGCPFNVNLQNDLDVLEKFFPNERKQCEIIWKPVYDEYRRIGYRLKNDNFYSQMTLSDFIDFYKMEGSYE